MGAGIAELVHVGNGVTGSPPKEDVKSFFHSPLSSVIIEPCITRPELYGVT